MRTSTNLCPQHTCINCLVYLSYLLCICVELRVYKAAIIISQSKKNTQPITRVSLVDANRCFHNMDFTLAMFCKDEAVHLVRDHIILVSWTIRSLIFFFGYTNGLECSGATGAESSCYLDQP